MKFRVPVLLALVALPYLSGLHHGFVYDDHGSIEDNRFLETPHNAWKAATLRTFSDTRVLDGQRPMVIISTFIDRAIWGLKPFGYHLTNLLLHLATVLLLFVLVRSLGLPAQSPIPFFAALLFGLHPVLTEAVQVPSFREDLLVTLFGLAYLLTSISFRSPLSVFASSFALGLALLSKESAVVLPVMLAWLWCCFPSLRPSPRAGIAALSVQFTLVAAYLVNAYTWRPLQAATGEWNGLSLLVPANFLTAPHLFLEALGLLLVPIRLCVEHLVDPILSAADPRFALGLAGLALFVLVAAAIVRRAPSVACGMGWILLGWIPVSNLVPLFNPLAERYVYFLAPGFALVLASALAALASRRLAWALVVALALAGGAATWVRLRDWRDDATLWTATINTEPRSARAHTWLGVLAKARGNRAEAVKFFRRADALNPQDVTALVDLAIIAGESGNLDTATRMLQEAVRRRPDKAATHWNLAFALLEEGKYRPAINEAEKTIELDPGNDNARELLRAAREIRKFQ